MDNYKAVVIDYLQRDRAMFVNTGCCIEADQTGAADKSGYKCFPDAVAIDLRHGAVYLCEAASGLNIQPLVKKLSNWTTHWDEVTAALQSNCKVPPAWRVYAWLFVPSQVIEQLDDRLEHLRKTVGSRFKVRITALEDVQPWRISSWERYEAEWETKGRRALA